MKQNRKTVHTRNNAKSQLFEMRNSLTNFPEIAQEREQWLRVLKSGRKELLPQTPQEIRRKSLMWAVRGKRLLPHAGCSLCACCMRCDLSALSFQLQMFLLSSPCCPCHYGSQPLEPISPNKPSSSYHVLPLSQYFIRVRVTNAVGSTSDPNNNNQRYRICNNNNKGETMNYGGRGGDTVRLEEKEGWKLQRSIFSKIKLLKRVIILKDK